MIPVLTSDGMREADRATIDGLGMSGLVLMENAAAAVSDVVEERFGDAETVMVACGPGNNGGDGLACARQLRCRGIGAEVALLVEPSTLKGDAATQLDLARAFKVPVHELAGQNGADIEGRLAGADVVVDALFGTGLARPLSGRWSEVVSLLNLSSVPVISVDIPSGLMGSSSQVPGEVVEASVTVTFAAPKVAHVLPPACWCCGEVAVAEIGIPPWVLSEQAAMWYLEARDVAGWLPRRPVDGHKGHFGHLVVVGGRRGRAGAAALAAHAGVVVGAGLVTVATPMGALAPIQTLVPEAMVDVLPEGPDGAASGEGIESVLEKASAVVVGPGLGTGEGPRRLLGRILDLWDGPLLLDADALTMLGSELGRLASRSLSVVLTPHPGELGRILGRATADVVSDRMGAAVAAASACQGVVLAKGARTVIVNGRGRALVNPTGSPGLASGGTGDVLAGVIGALLAQGVDGLDAAAAGAFLHGRAGELAGDQIRGAVPARDVIAHLAGAEGELRDLL